MFAFTLLTLRCVNIFYCKRGKDVETFRRWTPLDSNEKEISHGRESWQTDETYFEMGPLGSSVGSGAGVNSPTCVPPSNIQKQSSAFIREGLTWMVATRMAEAGDFPIQTVSSNGKPSVEQIPFRGYQSWAFSKVQLVRGPMCGFGRVMEQAPMPGVKLLVQIQTLSSGPPVTFMVTATRRTSCAVGFSMIMPPA